MEESLEDILHSHLQQMRIGENSMRIVDQSHLRQIRANDAQARVSLKESKS